MFTTFNVSSDDYDKFATMMMQEMEKAKAAKTKAKTADGGRNPRRGGA